jgi:eukaryotic-like serine/threonine-protein kinase
VAGFDAIDRDATVPGAVAAARAEPEPGERYVLLERLGEGGMGVVWAAYDRALDRKVALKLLHDRYLGAAHQERLVREARAMARLSHPNVVPVYDAGERQGRTFLTMEFVRGQPLDAWLEAARPWREVVEVFRAAARGLAAAHAAGIVHRDVKPSNILLGEDGRVRVADFGVAFAVETGVAEAALVTGAATEPSLFVGTPAYMAPEQLRGEPADERSDQFSLCVALHEALAGRHPFAGDTLEARLRAIEAGPPPLAEAPDWLARLIARGLAGEPAARFPSTEALIAALAGPRPSRWRRAVPVAVPALAMAGVVGVVLARRPAGAEPPPPCEVVADAAFAEAWTPAGRTELARAFATTGAAEAARDAERVAGELDRYAAAWRAGAVTSCRAVREHRWPADLGGLAERCLAERRGALAALVGQLGQADAAAVPKARDAVARLVPPTVCGDVDYLQARVAAPEDAGAAAAAAGLEELVAGLLLGRVPQEGRLAELRVQVEALGDSPLMARLLQVEAARLREEGQLDGAVAAVKRAYLIARRHRDVERAASAAADLVMLLGYGQERHELAEDWAALALVEIERIPMSEVAREVEQAVGVLAERRGDLARALAHKERAVEIAARLFGEAHVTYARAALSLAGALRMAGRQADAIALYRTLLPQVEQAFGADSRDFAKVLANAAIPFAHAGDHATARELAARALAIARADSVTGDLLGSLLLNQGSVLILAQESEAAAEPLEQARALFVEAGKPLLAAKALTNLGQIYRMRAQARPEAARIAQAAAAFEESARLVEAGAGPDHPDAARAVAALAALHAEHGRCADAVPHAERAIGMFERKTPSHASASFPLLTLGECRLAAGKVAAAIAVFERAVALRRDGGQDPALLAEAESWLGSALVAARQPERGRALLRAAHPVLTAAGARFAGAVARIERDLD